MMKNIYELIFWRGGGLYVDAPISFSLLVDISLYISLSYFGFAQCYLVVSMFFLVLFFWGGVCCFFCVVVWIYCLSLH